MISPDDTIAAIASSPGSAGRAVIRLSGLNALQVALTHFQAISNIEPEHRRVYAGFLSNIDLTTKIPAQLIVFPAPNSYTGQTVVEFHMISSPPLVENTFAQLLTAGARAAQPGEFTLRAFLAGKLDLPRAEAVLAVIESNDREELQQSLKQLAGGISRPLDGLRDDLLNLLADLEAGLDFADEDISFIDKPQMLTRLARALAQVTLVQKQVQSRNLASRPFRVALVGPPNVGKSSLFNALSGEKAIVSEIPGTTRDYLVVQIEVEEQLIELIDTAGWRTSDDPVELQAQQLGHEIIAQADLLLVCVEGASPPEPPIALSIAMEYIGTKSDLAPPIRGRLATSTNSGQGLNELRSLIAKKAREISNRGLAPSLSRCHYHVEISLDRLRRAHQGVLFDDPAEIVALELRMALENLGELTGAIYTDDLLDRVFSRFCIGK